MKKKKKPEIILMREEETSIIQRILADNAKKESRKTRTDTMCKYLEKILPKSDVAKFRKMAEGLTNEEFEVLWNKSQMIGEGQNFTMKK